MNIQKFLLQYSKKLSKTSTGTKQPSGKVEDVGGFYIKSPSRYLNDPGACKFD